MSKLFRSKPGYAVAGLYLLVTLPLIAAVAVFFILRYLNGNVDVHSIEEPISLCAFALTLPWSIIATLAGIIIQGGHGMHVGRLVLAICLIVGALINASVFYLFAHGVSMIINYIRKTEG
jgi:quinol-cytochrome oxidoreductase complex cytochrome b subunit